MQHDGYYLSLWGMFPEAANLFLHCKPVRYTWTISVSFSGQLVLHSPLLEKVGAMLQYQEDGAITD